MSGINSLIISLNVLLLTRVFAGIVFLEEAMRKKAAKYSVLAIGWFIYAVSSGLSLFSFLATGDINHPWLAVFVVMGTFCILFGLILFYLPVSIKKTIVVLICTSIPISSIPFVLPNAGLFITVGIQGVLILLATVIVVFRRQWIIKTGGVSSYVWLSVFLFFSLTGTSLHLFFPSVDQSVKFLITFAINLFLFMAFLHFDKEESFRRIKENEAIITRALWEKEILLKEVHHRVKNNMAIMVSLLNFQSSSSTDPELQEQLEKAQSRIEAMALVHEYLYESKNLSQIDFREYVQGLISYLGTLLGNDISIKLDIEDFKINPDLSVSCGLLINEIVSNSYKHAFTTSADRRISIEANIDDAIHLVLRDNGEGLPDSVDPDHSRGIGFQLINSLCHQLNAKMDIKNDNGTVFNITIPVSSSVQSSV